MYHRSLLLLSFLFYFPPLIHPLLDTDVNIEPSFDSKKLLFLQTTGLTAPLQSSSFSHLIRHHKHRDREEVASLEELILKLKIKRRRRHNNSSTVGGGGGGVSDKKLNTTWPLKRLARIEGDVWLGGLMMVHEREDDVICGRIMAQVSSRKKLLMDLKLKFGRHEK